MYHDKSDEKKLVDFELFDDEAISCLLCAESEARRIKDPSLSTYMMLLGILSAQEKQEISFPPSISLGVDFASVERYVASMVEPVEEKLASDVTAQDEKVPFTRAGKRAIELACLIAKDSDSSFVKPQHLLAGIISINWIEEGQLRHCKAYEILCDLGVDPQALLTKLRSV